MVDELTGWQIVSGSLGFLGYDGIMTAWFPYLYAVEMYFRGGARSDTAVWISAAAHDPSPHHPRKHWSERDHLRAFSPCLEVFKAGNDGRELQPE